MSDRQVLREFEYKPNGPVLGLVRIYSDQSVSIKLAEDISDEDRKQIEAASEQVGTFTIEKA